MEDPTLLVRALDRLYSRVCNFGRSLIEVIGVSENEDAPAGGDEQEETSAADRFRTELDASCLEMVLRIAAASSQFQMNMLRIRTADCFTDIRHQIVSNASAFRPGKKETK